MKKHLDVINKSNETIVSAEKQLARMVAELAKFQAAHTAAVQQAEALRADAGRALALVAVGATDEAAARKLVSESEAADQRVNMIAMTLNGLAENEATAEATAVAARQQRADATRAALNEHAEEVARVYRATALAFVDATRRVHAVEAISASMGHKLSLFRSHFDSRELVIPSLNMPGFESFNAGGYGCAIYAPLGELCNPAGSEQGRATEAEIALLAKAGIEV